MITNRKTGLLAFLAIVLILALSACSQPEGSGASTAQVRVTGTAAQSSAKQRAASDAVVFASGTVTLQGEDITSQLKPSQTGTAGGSNDVEFEADIPVASDVVLYSVSPRTGFVFDEWKITRANRSELKIDYPDSWWDVLVEIQNIIKDDSQTIYINPEYIEYIRPTFDRGYYLDLGAKEDGDGSAGSPFNKLDSIIAELGKDKGRYYDDDELTIKIRRDYAGDFNLDSLEQESYYKDESEIELKLIGGYDEDWNLSPEKTVISSITFPGLSGNNIEELEIELRNIELTELDYGKLPKSNDDFEIDFRNCFVGTLKNASGKIVNGLVVDKLENSSNAIFVNSSAPYKADNKYYHSIVRDADSNIINGQNNIVLAAAHSGVDGSGNETANLYLDSKDWTEGSYKTDNQTLITQITTAVPLSEDFQLPVTSSRDDDDFDADDLLEEDIEGRERYLSDDDYDDNDNDHDDDHDDDDDYRFDRASHDLRYRNIRVSYGPYEYLFFDD